MAAALWWCYIPAKQFFSQSPERAPRRSPDEDVCQNTLRVWLKGWWSQTSSSLHWLIGRIIKVTIFLQRIFVYIISLNHHYKHVRASYIHCIEKTQILNFLSIFSRGISRHSPPLPPPPEQTSTKGFCLGKKKKKKNSKIECDNVVYYINFSMSNCSRYWLEKKSGICVRVCVCCSLGRKIVTP